MDGVLNVNKKSGLTSHDVVQQIRNRIGDSKVGHTGTLDPMATGVLLLCIGKATKIVPYLANLEKEYVATLKLGIVTDTLDADGNILDQREVDSSIDDVRDILPSFLGEIEQVPPMFSAVRHGGRRLYEFARNGEVINRPTRTVHIFGIDVLSLIEHDLTIRVHCSKGTYVRSLASDIGDTLGCGAHVVCLKRTRVGKFRIEQSLTLKENEHLRKEDSIERHVIPMTEALGHLVEVKVGGEDRRRILHGTAIPLDDPAASRQGNLRHELVRITGDDDTLLGLGKIELNQSESIAALKPTRIFV